MFCSTITENKINNVGEQPNRSIAETWWDPNTIKECAVAFTVIDGTLPSRNCAANVEYAFAFKKKLLIINLISVLKGSLIL